MPPKCRKKRSDLTPLNIDTSTIKPVSKISISHKEETTSEISEIIENKLYLGAYQDAVNLKDSNDYGITRVISLGSENKVSDILDSTFEKLQIDIIDHADAPIGDEFKRCIDFIKKEGRVLVHCSRGISRSSTIVLAYLMKEVKMTLNEAYDLTRERRDCINPNLGFHLNLEKFQKSL